MDEQQPQEKLTKRQRAFIEYYLQSWNATDAARKAGYKNPNVRGSENVVKRSIAAVIASRIKGLAMTADEVTLRITQDAKLNVMDYFDLWEHMDKEGNRVTELRINYPYLKEHGTLVKGISYDKAGRTVLEFVDAQHAREVVAKMHGLLNDKLDLTVQDKRIVWSEHRQPVQLT